MDYKMLTDDQLADVRRNKLVQIEAEHAALSLDLELAAEVNLATEQVAQGRANLLLLERQHRVLSDIMWPPVEPSGNGLTARGPSGLSRSAPVTASPHTD
jgi:hypothetical protein